MVFKCFKKRNCSGSLPNSKRGQVTVELILMTAVIVVTWQVLSKVIKNGGYLDDFVAGPNQLIGHMIANGNWQKDEEESKDDHPNRYGRRWSWDPT